LFYFKASHAPIYFLVRQNRDATEESGGIAFQEPLIITILRDGKIAVADRGSDNANAKQHRKKSDPTRRSDPRRRS
jgi:hypothetical protein